MAGTKKISELPVAAALTGAELVPVVQGGKTVRSTADAIKTFNVGQIDAEVSTLDIRVTNLESNVAAVLSRATLPAAQTS
jgi:hypothetical protein